MLVRRALIVPADPKLTVPLFRFVAVVALVALPKSVPTISVISALEAVI